MENKKPLSQRSGVADISAKLNIAERSASALNWIKNNRKVVLVAVGAFFLFYWYEIRPISINHACSDEASKNAKTLLQSKAEATIDLQRKDSYNELIKKNMYLRTDYESYYKKCLRGYGVNII